MPMTNDEWGAPQNDLESSLVRAATDPSARPAFYRALADSQLLVVTVGGPPPLESVVQQAATTLQLAQIEIEGQRCLPVFSSEARLPRGARYVGMAARDLLSMTRGERLVLNPGSPYGKMLLPGEIAAVLDGSIFSPDEKVVTKAGTRVLIGQPRDYPSEFVAVLERYLATEPLVERAFLAQHFIPGDHTEPALLVAIDVIEGEFERISVSVGALARDTQKPQKVVDVTRFDRRADSYFADKAPFYVRRKRGLLGRLFG